MSENTNDAMDLTERIFKMSEEDQALMLRLIGHRQYKFPCMTETRIWRVAKIFNKNSGRISKTGAIETLETLLRAIKECDGE